MKNKKVQMLAEGGLCLALALALSYLKIPVAALGGSVAMYITMQTIRHKTQHPKFMIGIPAIMILQLALAAYIVWLKLF